MRSLKNLSTDLAKECPEPWTWNVAAPERVRKDKRARTAWITSRDTEHCVYALVEGVNPNARVRSPKGDNEGNDVAVVYGFAADIDAPLSDSTIAETIARLPFKPVAVERTLSGNVRLVYLLETPHRVTGTREYRVIASVVADKLRLAEYGGFDKPAFTEPSRYYTNSGEWAVVDLAARIPAQQFRGWWFEASAEMHKVFNAEGPVIPFEDLRTALAAKYPRFAEWPGDFVDNARGPSFWVDGSVSPMSAIVHETGIYTFAAHAVKPFYTWADLLGGEFVRQYQAAREGDWSDGIYWNGANYLMQDPAGKWRVYQREELSLFLRVSRGVSPARDRATQISDLDRVLNFIHTHKYMAWFGPCAGFKPGEVVLGQQLGLNTFSPSPCPASPDPQVWGPHGNFPFISALLDYMFKPEQKDVFLAWTAYGYENLCGCLGLPGQSLVLAGPPSSGKTLVASRLLGGLFGPAAEANDFFASAGFNGALFESYLWNVDDNTNIQTTAAKNYYSARLKALVANTRHKHKEKYQKESDVFWAGRIVITMNDDYDSLRQLPAMDMSNQDKTILLAVKPGFVFPSRQETEQILTQEMPFFAAYLRAYEWTRIVDVDTRYGLRAYHDPSLLQHAHESTDVHAFLEVLTDFLEQVAADAPNKKTRRPGDILWKGSSAALRQAVELSGSTAWRQLSVVRVGQLMAQLLQLRHKRFLLEAKSNHDNVRKWIIRYNGTPHGTIVGIGQEETEQGEI